MMHQRVIFLLVLNARRLSFHWARPKLGSGGPVGTWCSAWEASWLLLALEYDGDQRGKAYLGQLVQVLGALCCHCLCHG